MTQEPTLQVLIGAAASIAFVHTVIGVDHTLPFVVLAKARNWSLSRTLGITALCGLGHVLSSVVLGAVGIGLGTALEDLDWVQAHRGTAAAWLLVGFGLWLLARSIWRNLRGRVHTHAHVHADGTLHTHPHDHVRPQHRHPHLVASTGTVWTLFIIFVFGPCEPLIPLLMAPAALQHWSWVVIVCGVFGGITIGVMLAIVSAGYVGLGKLHTERLTRHADAFAGGAIALSGVAIQALGI